MEVVDTQNKKIGGIYEEAIEKLGNAIPCVCTDSDCDSILGTASICGFRRNVSRRIRKLNSMGSGEWCSDN